MEFTSDFRYVARSRIKSGSGKRDQDIAVIEISFPEICLVLCDLAHPYDLPRESAWQRLTRNCNVERYRGKSPNFFPLNSLDLFEGRTDLGALHNFLIAHIQL